MPMIRRFRNKLSKAIKASLRQGMSPEQLALTITLGVLFGIIPVIGLGTWNMRQNDCIESVKSGINMGYRHLDTAQNYGNEKANYPPVVGFLWYVVSGCLPTQPPGF